MHDITDSYWGAIIPIREGGEEGARDLEVREGGRREVREGGTSR